jgi:hypothetical protein
MRALRYVPFGVVLLLFSAGWAMGAEFPPERVARLQYVSGAVSIQPSGTGDWLTGAINRPVRTSDNVWADKNSRAEIGVGTGVLRINSETSLTLSNLSRGGMQVMLHQGTLNVHVPHLWGGEIDEVDTPNLAFTLQKPGDYRFDVKPGGDTTVVTVWKGEGTATGDGPAIRVRAHEQASFTGTSLAHNIRNNTPAPDGFDSWCQVRDKRADHGLFGPYPAPGVYGYPVPYPAGPWVWVRPWGWTWVR